MNYMPDIAYLALRRPGPQIVTTLRTHIVGLIPYVRSEVRGEEIWFVGGDNFATVEVLAPAAARRRVRVPRSLGVDDEHLIELCSGPNHDFSYFPVFHDVMLALLQFPGVRLLRGGEAVGLEAMQPNFERVMGRLVTLGAAEDAAISLRTAATALMSRIHQAFPALTATPSVLPWLIAGLTQDDEAAAATLADQLVKLRMPEALPQVEAVIRDPAQASYLPRLFAVYRKIAAGLRSALVDPPLAAAEDPWSQWVERYVLACRGHPGPLLAALADPGAAEDLLERADLTYFIHRAEGRPDFAAELDAYIEQKMDDSPRHEELLAAIVALCDADAGTWPGLPAALGEAGIACWRAAQQHVSRSLAQRVRALLAALGAGEEPPGG